jgi:predicted metalloenzyme YecM
MIQSGLKNLFFEAAGFILINIRGITFPEEKIYPGNGWERR